MNRAAILQMNSKANVQDNLTSLEIFFQNAREQEVKLMVLPENFAFMGFKDTDKLQFAEPFGEGQIQSTISQLAKKYKLWVIAGTLPVRSEDHRVKASSIVYDDEGKAVARYDKIHLFDVLINEKEVHQESATLAPGRDVVVVHTPIGCVGLSVCYDVRFPELYRQLTEKGAEIFVVPAAFTATTGAAHWEILLRARAIENLCYVLAPNQSGLHENGRHTYGHSMMIDPWGRILAEQKESVGMVTAEIDLSDLHRLRRQFPCNEHHVLGIL